LSGIILTARVRLRRVETGYIKLDYRRTPDLHATLDAMAESDERYPYSVAWIDCLAKGRQLGRSVIMWGRHATLDELPLDQAAHPLAVSRAMGLTMPLDLPGFVLNPLSVKAFNAAFYASHPTKEGAITDYNRYFYPLDSIGQWNRMYGKRGFIQFQVTIPTDRVDSLVRLLEGLGKSSKASFLAVLKRFGPAGRGLLSYPSPGYTLALDLPYRAGIVPLVNELHRIVAEAGGRVYTAKDATIKAEQFQAMYPTLDRFREIQVRLDPEGRLSSSMARRLGIVGAGER
ncbi:MAG: FAD-binding oxidoreductase, partial [Candidatus Hydrogenedentes bacterium]|nr:FAD-binding oxidoreductase [Candidatus Hydrogenedentota bacterium]